MKSRVLCHCCKDSPGGSREIWAQVGLFLRAVPACERCYQAHIPEMMQAWDRLSKPFLPAKPIEDIVRDHVRFVKRLKGEYEATAS